MKLIDIIKQQVQKTGEPIPGWAMYATQQKEYPEERLVEFWEQIVERDVGGYWGDRITRSSEHDFIADILCEDYHESLRITDEVRAYVNGDNDLDTVAAALNEESVEMSKPSWKDAPEGAKILVQNPEGHYIFGSFVSAHPGQKYWLGDGEGFWFRAIPGKPKGNWRNSLEFRPVIEESSPEEEEEFKLMREHNIYHREIFDIYGQENITVDVYSVLDAFKVTNPALQHLIKKALCAGLRGHKNEMQDMQDIIESAYRAKDMAGSCGVEMSGIKPPEEIYLFEYDGTAVIL